MKSNKEVLECLKENRTDENGVVDLNNVDFEDPNFWDAIFGDANFWDSIFEDAN